MRDKCVCACVCGCAFYGSIQHRTSKKNGQFILRQCMDVHDTKILWKFRSARTMWAVCEYWNHHWRPVWTV